MAAERSAWTQTSRGSLAINLAAFKSQKALKRPLIITPSPTGMRRPLPEIRWQSCLSPLHGIVAPEIQRIAWENCGIVRSAEGLREAAVQLEALAPQSPEERNMRQVALVIARCALARQESRGAHFRTDYPETREAFARHSVVSIQTDVTFR